MKTYEEDLNELDRIWPLGQKLVVPEGGTVLVAGAYEGRYMDYIATRFKPSLIVGFEPQKEKAVKASERLKGVPGAIIIDEGIGVHACMVAMERYGTYGCRVCSYTSNDMVRLNGIDDVLSRDGLFDLFICNMEGYEIPLLSYLCGSGRISEIKSLAVQFHSDNKRVADMLTKHYGEPIYEDWPDWMYWRSK